MYQALRRLLFILPAETAHYFSINLLRLFCTIGFVQKGLKSFFSPNNTAPFSLLGLSFRNRVGLGAGFDKNAKYLRELETLGFGFIEIGTVTPRPQAGNDKPRLFRLPKDNALINRMGFNNDGVNAIAERLKKWRMANGRWQMTDNSKNALNKARSSFNDHLSSLIIGGNIGKNKTTPNDEAWKDYEICFRA